MYYHLVSVRHEDVKKSFHVTIRIVHVHLTEGYLLTGVSRIIVSTINARSHHNPSVRPCSWVIINPTYFQYCFSSFGGFATINAVQTTSTNHLVDVRNLSIDVVVDSLRDRLSMEVNRLNVADVLPDTLLIKISFQVTRKLQSRIGPTPRREPAFCCHILYLS